MTDIELLTPTEAAKRLGVSPGTLMVWRSEKVYELAYIKIGGRVMYKLADILAFIEKRRVDPSAKKARVLTRPTRNHQKKGHACSAA